MLKQAIYTGHLAKLHGVKSVAGLFRGARGVGDFEPLGDRKWYSFNWLAPANLNLHLDAGALAGQANSYPFILRESSDRFILLSTHHSIVQAFFRWCGVEPQLEYPRVNIIDLVSAVIRPPEDQGRIYRLGAVFAAVEGYGRMLKTVAFWGDDIGDAGLFQEVASKISPFRTALRDIRTDREIVSIGSGGEVSFFYRGLGHLDQTDRLFRFLTGLELISWGISRG
jgi:hypothetical protein